MSSEGSFGLGFAEKFFGFIVLLVGLIVMYYTITSGEALQAFTGFFGLLSFIIIVVGLLLLTAKTE